MNLLKIFQAPPMDSQIQIVSQVPVFRECTRTELEALRLHLHERKFLAGEIVFDEGEQGEGMYVVISGRVFWRDGVIGGWTESGHGGCRRGDYCAGDVSP